MFFYIQLVNTTLKIPIQEQKDCSSFYFIHFHKIRVVILPSLRQLTLQWFFKQLKIRQNLLNPVNLSNTTNIIVIILNQFI